MKRFDQQLNDFQWTDCEAPSASDLLSISQEFDIPLFAIQSGLHPENLPKCEFLPDTTHLNLRVYDSTAKPKDGSIQELSTKLLFFIREKHILTIHRSVIQFVSDKREHCVHEPTLTAKNFLKFLISQSIMTYDGAINDIESQTLQIEERVYSLKRTHILRDGYLIKRRASAFRKIFRFTSDALGKMSSHEELIWDEFQDVRDLLNRFSFYSEDAVENITGLLNLHLSLLSQKTNEASFKTNEVMRVLTVFSIFFLPLNFIAGVYGMNFDYMPELKSENGYFMTLLVMLLIALVIFIWAQRKGWLNKPDEEEQK
jgi:magnesium transporter